MKSLPLKPNKQKNFKAHLGRAALYLGILLLLLIPSYIAAATYTAKKNAPVIDIHTEYESMTLVGPTSFVQTASAELNTELFSIFTTLCQEGEEVVFIPDRYHSLPYTFFFPLPGVAPGPLK